MKPNPGNQLRQKYPAVCRTAPLVSFARLTSLPRIAWRFAATVLDSAPHPPRPVKPQNSDGPARVQPTPGSARGTGPSSRGTFRGHVPHARVQGILTGSERSGRVLADD